LSLSSGSVDAQIGAGQVLLARKESVEAAAAFDRILERDPGNAKALNGAGLARDDLRQHTRAQAFYRRALEIDPEDRTVRNNLGLSLALSGNLDEAIAILRKLANEPDALPRYRENLAFALSRRPSTAAPGAEKRL
jgi:Flp pilus assembly protein TadD